MQARFARAAIPIGMRKRRTAGLDGTLGTIPKILKSSSQALSHYVCNLAEFDGHLENQVSEVVLATSSPRLIATGMSLQCPWRGVAKKGDQKTSEKRKIAGPQLKLKVTKSKFQQSDPIFLEDADAASAGYSDAQQNPNLPPIPSPQPQHRLIMPSSPRPRAHFPIQASSSEFPKLMD